MEFFVQARIFEENLTSKTWPDETKVEDVDQKTAEKEEKPKGETLTDEGRPS